MSTFDPGRSQPPPPLMVRTDRRAVRRWHSRIVIVHAALAVVVLVAMVLFATVLDGALSGIVLAPFAFLVLNQIFQIGYHCYLWGGRAALEVPLVVSAGGLTFTTVQGIIWLPWPAVESVSVQSRFFGRIMIVRPHPGVQVDSPGVQICFPASTWTKVVRRGLLLGERGLWEDLDQVVSAIVSASAGRVIVR